MSVQLARTHGRAKFQRALEGDEIDVEPFGFKEPFVMGDVQDKRVRGGQDAEPKARSGGGQGDEEQGQQEEKAFYHE